ncbi:hypothetical protein PCO31111_01979 [Pandoraea communis]|uniref:Uncharacterized protein n=1 Tax=Pandoraea communis TaxID=2508297 RepID=A0A5E4UC95_9BURK|nr:hypothetical protein PCO31111_01979 [Pandoraea communis]
MTMTSEKNTPGACEAPGVSVVPVMPFALRHSIVQTSNSSTSKTSVAFGGITPPAPRAP